MLSVDYQYDGNGNRIKKTEGERETRYRYNQKNQLLQKEDADGISYFTYDRQGGIMEEKNAAGNRRFTYNNLHQQTQVETETGNIQKNRYDVEGLRYELIENGRRTSFVYHNGEFLHEKGEEAGLSKETISYHLGAGIEAFQRDSKTYYYHQDEQLNTTLISDEKAAIRNHYQYDAFGAGLDAIEALPNRIRYAGQQYDEQTEQYYLRARYYNPVLGRFMQEDVYQGDGLNLYAYCANNPVVYYDPSGYTEFSLKNPNLAKDCSWQEWQQNTTGSNDKKAQEYYKYTGKKSGFSARDEYMGPTPSNNKKIREEIAQEMEHWKEGDSYIKRNKKGEVVKFRSLRDGKWHNISEAHLAHKNPNFDVDFQKRMGYKLEGEHKDAVVYWNEKGKFTGPRSKEVRKWMNTASNYYFELAKYNCSDGGYIKGENGRRITYDDPVTNETNGVNNCKKN